ncbi:MAG TPA: phosphonate metabolism protein/1,5-bisphosphokinase (PRPP-forming) PhnN [Proteobacteria bacterium]|mgnify:CR=1 FL=1|nr:phosphonate metabolism protein/1,5-bisphosphokinase (PRPP-forming) PhnN [Pseudomonadota bacterium]
MPGPGQLFYLMGDSGAGKNTLFNYARAKLQDDKNIKFALRYITRPTANNGTEEHISITHEDFKRLLQADFFAMFWTSHGFHYGISTEINRWLAQNDRVVIIGSRQYYHTAKIDYPQLHAVLIQAEPDLLLQRLRSRNREKPEEIKQRLSRNAGYSDFRNLIDTKFTIIENNLKLEAASRKLINVICKP